MFLWSEEHTNLNNWLSSSVLPIKCRTYYLNSGLFLNNYDKFEQTILHGGIFRADNAQVVKMGLGALDSVKGMTRYVKVNALADFLVGSGINGLKYLLTDDYSLKLLGVDSAKSLVHIAIVSGITLGIASLLTAPLTFVAGASLYLAVGFGVFVVDKITDFEKKLVEEVINEFDE